MKNKYLAVRAVMTVLSVLLLFNSCVKSNQQEPPVEPAERNTPPATITPPTNTIPLSYNYAVLSDSLQVATYNTFITGNGEYFKINNNSNTDFDYGPNAQMLDVLTDGYQRQPGNAYLIKMKALLRGIKDQNGDSYANAFYDDMGILANASMRDHVLTQDVEYLNAAKLLYFQIKFALNNSMDGGVAGVANQPDYKTTYATGNLCILAARLYKLQSNPDDLALAIKMYNWMKAKVVSPVNGQVKNGVNRNNDGLVDNRIFSHNQGIFIGAAIELFTITRDRAYIQDAVLTANNALSDSNLVFNGILKSDGQGDAGLYKGILVRYLTALIEVGDLDNATRKVYTDFLQKNAQLLYYSGIARPSLMISPDWSLKPGTNTDFTTQLSGLVMMEAAARLKAAGRIE